MSLIIILSFCIIGFGLYLAFPMRQKGKIVYLLAIGSIVNAPIFNCIDFPFKVFGVSMGLDSVVYFLFIFTMLLTHAYCGKKQALDLMLTSVAAVLFAALIQFLSRWASQGLTKDLGFAMLKFIATSISSLSCGLVLFKLYDILKAKGVNLYLNASICLIVAGIVENIVFYGALIVFGYVDLSVVLSLLGGLYLGKAIGLVFALATIFISQKYKKDEKIPYNG